jgi:hypothetical protein
VLVVAALAVAAQRDTSAHFKLIEPASWLVENNRGDPQKAGPCGGTNTDWGKPSHLVTKVVGGQKLHLSPPRGSADYRGRREAGGPAVAGRALRRQPLR